MKELLNPQEMEQVIKSVAIPPRPGILVDLSAEMKRPDFDVRTIARLVGLDVGLAAAVLRTVNSPFFGLRAKVGSVGQAVSILGVKNIAQIVTAQLLRKSVPVGGAALERFWDGSERVAGIAATLAGNVLRMQRDEAYSFGLFRDVGIPLLAQRFPDYTQTLQQAEAQPDQSMVVLEEARHATTHTTVGYLVAKTWYLPQTLCQGILHHHDLSVLQQPGLLDEQTVTLVAINALAEHIHDGASRNGAPRRWEQHGRAALDHLGISDGEFQDITDQMEALMA